MNQAIVTWLVAISSRFTVKDPALTLGNLSGSSRLDAFA